MNIVRYGIRRDTLRSNRVFQTFQIRIVKKCWYLIVFIGVFFVCRKTTVFSKPINITWQKQLTLNNRRVIMYYPSFDMVEKINEEIIHPFGLDDCKILLVLVLFSYNHR